MKKMTTRELTLAALFVAVTAVLSQIVIPMPLVPFNLAVLAVFLCGSLLPKGRPFSPSFATCCWGPSACRCTPSFRRGHRCCSGSPAATSWPTR